MTQQIIAFLVILYFLIKLIVQRKNKQVSGLEFLFWLFFWLLAGLTIVLLKEIDALVAYLGFSATGINALLYLSVAILFYLIFKLRLKLEKTEREITKIVRAIALKK
ncbi:TPA: DUF2304 domain-containing protein [Candidatus Falkowbacteria bacterium]|nr:DUF2304 domain-containing protein [Candidatus Falkowbacteria bacterium]HAY12274.1 DUF2304 domain-containing protein [Candidatus Falkowbacteria bacterium]HBI96531.1 DUF2304 domain-containing protein [Candidatus Falkowbacteria bacterium]HBT27673.1 DUF2304 domain-containing protein [Candidatus Falkowbacteria bacterium]HBY15243.1 DUF2304 domain-containing protein [Candidatus Falkowbacteria bacterium]